MPSSTAGLLIAAVPLAEVAVVVVGYAIGPAIQSRWMSDLPGAGGVAVSLGLAALVYLPFVGFTGGFPTRVPSLTVILAVVAFAAICSAAAFLMMLALIKEIGPRRMTTITYVNPAVAIIAGVAVLGEKLTVWTVVGFVLVLSGSFLVTRRRRSPDLISEVVSATVTDAAGGVASGPGRG